MTGVAEKCPTCRGSIVRLVGLLRGASPVYAEVCLACAVVVRSGHLEGPRSVVDGDQGLGRREWMVGAIARVCRGEVQPAACAESHKAPREKEVRTTSKKPTYYRVVDRNDFLRRGVSGFTKKDVDEMRRKGTDICITGTKKYGDKKWSK